MEHVRDNLTVTFLGTGAAAPTGARNVAGTLIQRGPERFLVDCGEGTQRQLVWSYAGLTDLETILLTHTHADHYLGLPGLLKTFGARNQREKPLRIFGPPGTWMLMRTLAAVIGVHDYPLQVVEFEGGEALRDTEGYTVRCLRVDHRLPALGWVLEEDPRPGRFDVEEALKRGVPSGPLLGELQAGRDVEIDGRRVSAAGLVGAPQPGRKVVLSGDTRPCPALTEAAEGADLLVHEGTFLDTEMNEALKSGHSTVREAAEVARTAGVSLLALNHISSRYRVTDLLAAAKPVFSNTVVPADFDQVEVPLRGRGLPKLVKGGGRAPKAKLPGE